MWSRDIFLLVCVTVSRNVQEIFNSFCDKTPFFFYVFSACKTFMNSSSWIPVPGEDRQLEQEYRVKRSRVFCTAERSPGLYLNEL